jgi:hypothetical protein
VIIDKQVLVTLNPRNIEYYRKLGYDIDINNPSGKKILVNINELLKGSSVLVNVECDYCNKLKIVTFKEYNRNVSNNNKFSCSNKCGSIKKKEISILKYGVESPSMLNYIKIKNQNTNIEKYGSKFYMTTDEFKNKSKETMLLKYGVENSMYNSEIKNKLKETILKRYGVENSFQSEEIKNNIKEINLVKYGVEYYSQTYEFKDKFKKTMLERYGVEYYNNHDKIKETNLERYGVENYMSSNNFKEKSKITNLERYGVEYYNNHDKIKETNLERYGVENYMTSNEFKEKSKITNLERYGNEFPTKSNILRKSNNTNCKDINYINYIGNNISSYYCNKGHNFEIKSDNYHSRIKNNITLCTVCYPIGDQKSIKEKELLEYIKSNYSGEIISSYRDGLEIDIYLPELKIGFEFNGLYFHSNKFKDKNYHLNKTNHFKEKGIKIIHIWEDDYDNKFEIIKSQIKNILKINTGKIFARKCFIKVVNVKECKQFLDDNHIQGTVSSSIKIGLYFNDELVSLITFNNSEGRKKMELGGWNLNRFCNKCGVNVVGGASKLLKYFMKNYDVKRIVSYADKDWSVGDLYYTLGFTNVGGNGPDYKYIVDGKRVHKSRYKKSKLKTELTESKQMEKDGFLKIYDCGKLKFELK